jgi:tetratricopeptide (TPR) repeat protein
VTRQSIETKTTNNFTLANCMNSLGIALFRKYQRSSELGAIDESIDILDKSISLMPAGHPKLGTHLDNLGSALALRFKSSNCLDDLRRAVDINQQAVALRTSEQGRAFALNNLSVSLQSLFEQTRRMEEIDRAVEVAQAAIKLTPTEHVTLAMFHFTLGRAWQLRCSETKLVVDAMHALEAFERCATVEQASALLRIKACRHGSEILILSNCRDSNANHVGLSTVISRPFERARNLLRIAIGLLHLISDRTLNHSDQQYNILELSGIASNAAAVYLECGDPSSALSALERGRGLMNNILIDYRSDISRLRPFSSALAKKVDDVRFQLAVLHEQDVTLPEQGYLNRAEERRKLSNELDSLLREIRDIPELADFFLPPSEDKVKSLSGEGPIVIFNVSSFRSDAIIVTKENIQSLRLEQLTPEAVFENVSKFLQSVDNKFLRRYSHSLTRLKEVLSWIWVAAAKPVLEFLHLTKRLSESDDWPRVWWIGTGLLNLLPIHAAGYHDLSPTQRVIDHVISSYSPTLRSLAYARERFRDYDRDTTQKMLVIAMPETPNAASLKYVSSEIDRIRDTLSKEIDVTILRGPEKSSVVPLLSTYQFVHFACHGVPSYEDPYESKLLLKDWEKNPLTVSALSRQTSELSTLAVVTSCHSATMRELNLLDESVSLASSLQLAGYSSVIGALWLAGDEASGFVSEQFYRGLLDCNGRLEPRHSAKSLHFAIRALEVRGPSPAPLRTLVSSDPLIWASYVHIGV